MAETWRDANYGYRKEITIQDANVDSNLTDFPVLIKVDADTDITTAKVQADGDDVRFYDGSGNLLKFEVNDLAVDGTDMVANFWVKKPTVYGTPSGTDNKVWMYYGYASATNGEDAANVWDANYQGVWHLEEDPSGTAPQMTDSAGSNNGTTVGTMTSGDSVAGKIGNGLDCDGTDDGVDVGNVFDASGSALTVSAWIYPHDISSQDRIYHFNETGDLAGWGAMQINPTGGNGQIQVAANFTGGFKQRITSSAVSQDAWTWVTWTDDGTTSATNGTKIYFGDVEQSYSATGNSSGSGISTGKHSIGIREFASGLEWDGVLGEVRISNTIRSGDWLKFEYRNMAETDNELTWGAEEVVSEAGDRVLLATGSDVALLGTALGDHWAIEPPATPSDVEGLEATLNSDLIELDSTTGDIVLLGTGVASDPILANRIASIERGSAPIATSNLGGVLSG